MSEKWRDDGTHEIVGVVSEARYFDLRRAVEPMIYQPAYRERGANASLLTVRTTDDSNRLIDAIRRVTRDIEGAVSVTDTRTMEDNMNRTLMQERFVATLGGFFGVVALMLAAIGLYGVMAQSVTRRTREIGIRMALGAEARKVLWLVLRDAIIMVAIGTVIGAAAALTLTKYTESMLYGVKAQDPWTLAAAGAVLIAVTAMAGFLPARRATRIEPMRALREE
jgi:ABC-type antimicrobial peptide transport system permease subunit